jgi:membrane fusion protein, heavy metal efflux system
VKKIIVAVAITLAAALSAGVLAGCSKSGSAAQTEVGHQEEKGGQHEEKGGHHDEKEGHDEHGHGAPGAVTMTPAAQKENGVAVAPVKKQRLPGSISATGKVEVNADRIAHVSPRISGKVVAVRASLGDAVATGQTLATLDSVELGEALSRYHQSRTRLGLAQSNMERVRILVEKKIAARKEILQAETEYKTAQTELHTDRERLALYGASASELDGEKPHRPLLPLRAPISGIITEKHAIVGELGDPSKSLYTVADLSSVWVMVDIHEKDLAKVRRGQPAAVIVGAFPELKFKGRVTYIADVVDEATRTVKARVEVSNPGKKLKPEMFATVQLAVADDAPAVLAVPEDALQDLDGKKVVFVADSADKFAARPVETGRASGGMVEIVSGLKEGEPFAVKGSFLLKSEVKKGELVDEHGH